MLKIKVRTINTELIGSSPIQAWKLEDIILKIRKEADWQQFL